MVQLRLVLRSEALPGRGLPVPWCLPDLHGPDAPGKPPRLALQLRPGRGFSFRGRDQWQDSCSLRRIGFHVDSTSLFREYPRISHPSSDALRKTQAFNECGRPRRAASTERQEPRLELWFQLGSNEGSKKRLFFGISDADSTVLSRLTAPAACAAVVRP